MTDNTETALAPIAEAQRMLAAATTFEDFRNIRDLAETARAYAKARGLGIDSENTASEFVLRAERGMGKTMLNMREAGLFGQAALTKARWARGGPAKAADMKPEEAGLHTIKSLGLTEEQSRLFQRLASQWSDEEFERRVATVKTLGARIAKVDFYRGPKQVATRDRAAVREAAGETAPAENSSEVSALVRAAEAVSAVMPQLPADELIVVAETIKGLVSAYNAARTARS